MKWHKTQILFVTLLTISPDHGGRVVQAEGNRNAVREQHKFPVELNSRLSTTGNLRRSLTTETVAVDNVRTLLSTKAVDGMNYQTRGYYEANDGGGNTYCYRSKNREIPDGGTVLPGVGGTMFLDIDGKFVGKAGQGRFIAVGNQPFNPIKFGAIPNGKFNTRNYFQAMFDAMPDSASVVIPTGTYLFEDDSAGNAFVNVEDKRVLHIEARGRIRLGPRTGYVAFRFTSSTSVPGDLDSFVWNGGILDGNKSQQNYTDARRGGQPIGNGKWELDIPNYGLIGVRNYKQAVIQNVVLMDHVSDGIVFSGNLYSIAENVYGTGGASPQPDGFPQTIKFRVQKDGSTAHFRNCKIEDSNIALSAQGIKHAFFDSQLQISNCQVSECYQSAIYNEGVNSLMIDNCNCRNSFGPIHQLVKARNKSVRISNSFFEGGKIESGAYLGIRSDARISNCTVRNNLNNSKGAGKPGPSISGFQSVESCFVQNSPFATAVRARFVSNTEIDQSGTTQGGIEGAQAVTGGKVTGGNEAFGISARGTLRASNVAISNFRNGILFNGKRELIVNGCILRNLQEAAISCKTASHGFVSITACRLEDFGKDQNAGVENRCGISGSGSTAVLLLTNCFFSRSQEMDNSPCRAISWGSEEKKAQMIGIQNVFKKNIQLSDRLFSKSSK